MRVQVSTSSLPFSPYFGKLTVLGIKVKKWTCKQPLPVCQFQISNSDPFQRRLLFSEVEEVIICGTWRLT